MQKRIKVNRKHYISVDNIAKLEKKKQIVWIHRKNKYPKIIKTNCNFDQFLLKLVNSGMNTKEIEIIKNDTNKK